MNPIRLLARSLLFLGASAFAACGSGGGGGDSSPGGTATVAGRVALRDGTTQSLGGIEIGLVGLDRTTTTASDGSFSFGNVPAGDLAISVRDPRAPVAAPVVSSQSEGSDDGEDDDLDDGDDDDGDDDDVGDDDFDVVEVRDDDDVTVTITIRDGCVESVEISHGDDGRVEVHLALERTDVADDADATGHVEMEVRPEGQKLVVEAEHLDAGRELEAFVVCEGVDATLGTRTVDVDGEAEWELATNDGDSLPHGATTIADLAGCAVEVRDAAAGLVLLRLVLPEISDVGSGDDEDDEDGEDDEAARGRSALVRAPGGAGSGYVEIERRLDGGLRNDFEVEVEHLPSGTVVEVWVADAGGTLAWIATMTIGDFGEAELELESEDGDPMPHGVADVADLVGRAVEVRRASDGVTLLVGTVPALVAE